MAKRITLGTLANKIDYLHDDVKEIKNDVKTNTEFRMQAKGFMAAFMLMTSAATALIMKLFDKFR